MARRRLLMLGAPLDSFYGKELWAGIHSGACDLDCDLIYVAGGFQHVYSGNYSPDSPPNEARSTLLYELIDSSAFDGILMWGAQWLHDGTEAQVNRLIASFATIPMLSIGWEGKNVRGLYFDNYHVMKAMVSHLIQDHGHTRLAFIKAPTTASSWEAEERYRAWCDAQEACGLVPDGRLIVSGAEIEHFSRQLYESYAYTEDWSTWALDELVLHRALVPGKDFTALVCRDDESALRVIARLDALGYRVPEDVAVVGFDDVSEAASSEPGLTTVSQNFNEQGRRAVEIMLRWLDGSPLDAPLVLNIGSLKLRESCGCMNVYVRMVQDKGAGEQVEKTAPGFDRYFKGLAGQIGAPLDAKALASLGIAHDLVKKEMARDRSRNSERQARITKIDRDVFRSYDLGAVVAALEAELPELGAEACSLVLFESTAVPERSRLVYSSRAGNQSSGLREQGLVFPTSQLLPEKWWPPEDQRYSLYVEVLCFATERLGYLVLEQRDRAVDPPYFTLPARLGGILKGSILVQDLQKKTLALEAAYQEILALSDHDSLTGLSNRRALDRHLSEELARVRRHTQASHVYPSIMFIDLDNFKYYNDTFGHGLGDACLKVFGSFLQHHCRTSDLAARMGGDEFMVLLPETELGGAEKLASRLLAGLQESRGLKAEIEAMAGIVMDIPEEKLLSCSIGLAHYKDAWSASEFLAAADEGLYAAKTAGKSTWRCAGQLMPPPASAE